ncbi:MAG: alpha/beta hydrolase [Luteolibacter sp.]
MKPDFQSTHPTIRLWGGVPPGDETLDPTALKAADFSRDDLDLVKFVTNPYLTLFRPPANISCGTTVIICPGGAYEFLSFDKEGTEIACWLNTLGITAAILAYRVPRRSQADFHRGPVQDSRHAVTWLRENADALGIRTDRIGMLGFSAGAHLALASTSIHEAGATAENRPDFVGAIYPAYLANEEIPSPLDPLFRSPDGFPPVFLSAAQNDMLRSYNAAQFYLELFKSNIPTELHLYPEGGHGYGIRRSEFPASRWHLQFEEWLRCNLGFIR